MKVLHRVSRISCGAPKGIVQWKLEHLHPVRQVVKEPQLARNRRAQPRGLLERQMP
ncbi:MAG: hypothetical protein ACREJC_14395 [Tepidisphaeraceae bacterium]